MENARREWDKSTLTRHKCFDQRSANVSTDQHGNKEEKTNTGQRCGTKEWKKAT